MKALSEKDKGTILTSISYYRCRITSYCNSRGDAEVVALQDKLRNGAELTKDEAKLAQTVLRESTRYITQYDYGPNLDGTSLRKEALMPVYQALDALDVS